MSMIFKSISRILTALFLTVTILIAAVFVYWFFSAAPDVETASFVGLTLLSLLLGITQRKRYFLFFILDPN